MRVILAASGGFAEHRRLKIMHETAFKPWTGPAGCGIGQESDMSATRMDFQRYRRRTCARDRGLGQKGIVPGMQDEGRRPNCREIKTGT